MKTIPKNDAELLEMLRAGIESATTKDGKTVPVYLSNKYFDRAAMDNAITALETFGQENAKAVMLMDSPRKLTGLERLGMCLLMDAAGIKMPEKS